jgi:hypothetical protein
MAIPMTCLSPRKNFHITAWDLGVGTAAQGERAELQSSWFLLPETELSNMELCRMKHARGLFLLGRKHSHGLEDTR